MEVRLKRFIPVPLSALISLTKIHSADGLPLLAGCPALEQALSTVPLHMLAVTHFAVERGLSVPKSKERRGQYETTKPWDGWFFIGRPLFGRAVLVLQQFKLSRCARDSPGQRRDQRHAGR